MNALLSRGWFTRPRTRPARGSWRDLVVSILESSLLYTVGLLWLYPFMGVQARAIRFPFVLYWGSRWGIKGGVIAAILVDYGLAEIINRVVGLPVPAWYPGKLPMLVAISCLVGVLTGRLKQVSDRLKRELASRKRAETLLRESESCYRLLFESNPHPMWVVEAETLRFMAVNGAAVEHYGYSEEEFYRITVDVLVVDDGPGPSRPLAVPVGPFPDRTKESRHRKKDGGEIDVEETSHRVVFKDRDARLVLSRDVTERKRVQVELEYQARHDSLTGLPNRVAFQELLRAEICKAGPFAIFLLDLDRFKEINDTLGHAFGDVVLKELNPRLHGRLRAGDVMARLGGDEFSILLPGTHACEALEIGERLLDAIREPFTLEGQAFDVGMSIGIALHPDHAEEADALVRKADLAMYAAKRSDLGVVLYDPGLEAANGQPWECDGEWDPMRPLGQAAGGLG